MNPIIVECEQRSEEWNSCRLGIPTASNFDAIVTSKGEPSKQVDKYLAKLATERITGNRVKGFESEDMLRGAEIEADALSFYEFSQGVEIRKIGFAFKDDNKRFGASPDGLVGEDGSLELKCPLAHTHVEYLIDNKLPTAYIVQVQGQLFVTGRKWVDFMSFYPGLRPLIIRVYRDEVLISKLEMALVKFCQDLDALVEKIR